MAQTTITIGSVLEETHLVRGARVGAGVHEPPDHVRVAGDRGVMEGGLVVRIERVQAHIVDVVQQEVDDGQTVVSRRTHQQRVLFLRTERKRWVY